MQTITQEKTQPTPHLNIAAHDAMLIRRLAIEISREYNRDSAVDVNRVIRDADAICAYILSGNLPANLN